MISKSLFLLASSALMSIPTALFAQDEADAPAIEPMALKIITRATDHLAAAKYFSVSAEIWQDLENEDGVMQQFSKLVDVKVRRPDGVRLDVRTDAPKRSIYYDGKAASLLDHGNGFYGTIPAPATIDEALGRLGEKYAINVPLEDILISRPFGGGVKNASAGQYLGVEPVLGALCHHVAFQAEGIDWQAWVKQGAAPTIRKVLITFKNEEGAPQFTAIFSDWDMATPLPDFLFTLDPPAGTMKIDILAAEKEEEPSK